MTSDLKVIIDVCGYIRSVFVFRKRILVEYSASGPELMIKMDAGKSWTWRVRAVHGVEFARSGGGDVKLLFGGELANIREYHSVISA